MYQTIFENTGNATVIFDEDTTILLANAEFENLFHYTREETEGKKSWRELVLDEDRERLMDYHRRRRVDPESVPKKYELKIVDRQGFLHDVYMTVAMIPGTKKSVASIMDITPLKEAEKALHESETLYQTLFENAGIAIVNLDPQAYYLHVNDNYLEFIGYTWEELKNRQMTTEIVHPDYVEQIENLIVQQKNGKINGFTEEIYFIRKDGTLRWGEVRAASNRDKQGRMLSVVVAITDRTERKQVENALAENEVMYRNLFENASIGMFQTTLEGKFLRINKAYAAMLGYESREEVISTITDTATQIHADPRNRAELLAALEQQDWFYAEQPYLRKDGSIMIGKLAIRKVVRQDGASAYLEGLVEDITERKRAEEALINRERELRIKAQHLTEVNTTLKVLLNTLERDQEELKERFLTNIQNQVLPYLNKLKKSPMQEDQRGSVEMAETHLLEIASPFTQKLTSSFLNLTKKEIQIAYLVKEGKTSKEIAELLNAKQRVIEFHRENIRSKLGLKNKKGRLAMLLRAFS